jgi:hypothetical protein
VQAGKESTTTFLLSAVRASSWRGGGAGPAADPALRRLLCAGAADFNEDAKVNISDPIGILGHLFLGGGTPAVPKDVLCSAGE